MTYTPDNTIGHVDANADMMRKALAKLNKTYDDYKKKLEAMPQNELNSLRKECGLPSDLNRTQTIKYILQKQFPPR